MGKSNQTKLNQIGNPHNALQKLMRRGWACSWEILQLCGIKLETSASIRSTAEPSESLEKVFI